MTPCETKGGEGGVSDGIGGIGGTGVVGEEGGTGIEMAHMANPLYDRAHSKSKLSRLASMRTQSQVAHEEAHPRRAFATSEASPARATTGASAGEAGGDSGRDFIRNPACTGSDELVELANSDARLSRRKIQLKSMQKQSSILL